MVRMVIQVVFLFLLMGGAIWYTWRINPIFNSGNGPIISVPGSGLRAEPLPTVPPVFRPP